MWYKLGDAAVIRTVRAGSAAEAAGLVPNLLLETINGESAGGYSTAVETIKGTRPLTLTFAQDPVEEVKPQKQNSNPTRRVTEPEAQPEAEPAATVQRPDFSELVKVQYGGKGDFQQVRLEITHGGDMVLYTHTEHTQQREEVQRAKLSGCSIADPKKTRKGHEHAVRLDVAEGAGTAGDLKYIVSAGSSVELQTLKVFLQLHSEKATAKVGVSGPGKKSSKKQQKQAGSQKKSQGSNSSSAKTPGKK
jgi:hypothetical protein